MTDRDLILTQVQECRRVNADIRSLFEHYYENDMTKDEVANILLGIDGLSEIRFAQLEEMIRNLVVDK